ncbi:hypothetical protein CYMTET_56934 [Cymbomonas tetramitiformis]|uniref:Uncharacterized protein n=1 Tax=Cymbomonas tetramitiformis TaxID=36881 RepID=A0AAE0BB67_9CHLO|nr:hypothetical protein CYMTET_56934 [Cymbomonas tetramitiformis]
MDINTALHEAYSVSCDMFGVEKTSDEGFHAFYAKVKGVEEGKKDDPNDGEQKPMDFLNQRGGKREKGGRRRRDRGRGREKEGEDEGKAKKKKRVTTRALELQMLRHVTRSLVRPL